MQGTRCAKFHPALDIPHAELILRKGYDAHIDSYSAARATPCLPQEIRPRAAPGDPVFFAPDRPDDVPRKITEEHLPTETLAAMKRADTPPAIVYAYRKTGLLLMEEMQDNYPPARVAEWKAAIAENERLAAERNGG